MSEIVACFALIAFAVEAFLVLSISRMLRKAHARNSAYAAMVDGMIATIDEQSKLIQRQSGLIENVITDMRTRRLGATP